MISKEILEYEINEKNEEGNLDEDMLDINKDNKYEENNINVRFLRWRENSCRYI